MNLDRHVDAHRDMFNHLVRGRRRPGREAPRVLRRVPRRDGPDGRVLPADGRRPCSSNHDLPKGEMLHRGEPVDLLAIRRCAIMAVEGEKDDISGVGQTLAALELTPNLAGRPEGLLPAGRRRPLRRVQRLALPVRDRAPHRRLHRHAMAAATEEPRRAPAGGHAGRCRRLTRAGRRAGPADGRPRTGPRLRPCSGCSAAPRRADPATIAIAHEGRTFPVAIRRRTGARRLTLRVSGARPHHADAPRRTPRWRASSGSRQRRPAGSRSRLARLPRPIAFVPGALVPLRGVPHRIVLRDGAPRPGPAGARCGRRRRSCRSRATRPPCRAACAATSRPRPGGTSGRRSGGTRRRSASRRAASRSGTRARAGAPARRPGR